MLIQACPVHAAIRSSPLRLNPTSPLSPSPAEMGGQRAGTGDATLEKWATRSRETREENRNDRRRDQRREDSLPGRGIEEITETRCSWLFFCLRLQEFPPCSRASSGTIAVRCSRAFDDSMTQTPGVSRRGERFQLLALRLLFLCPWTQGACGKVALNARLAFTRHCPFEHRARLRMTAW